MARKELAYPASPKNVPEDLTIATPKFMFQATLLLVSLFLFMLIYLGMMVGCVLFVYWLFTSSLKIFFLFQIVGSLIATLFFLFLVKGFFSRDTFDRSGFVEITEQDQPDLYDFIEQLCHETGATFPNRIYTSPEVNAGVMFRLSPINLFVPVKKDLLIGLGLVNFLNLSEFKAVIAHELGHFAQKGFINSYTYVCRSVIATMVTGNDWLDVILERTKNSNTPFSAVANVVWWMIHGTRKFLTGVYKGITFLDFLIARQREFNADLVAVSVAGSDAIVHGLKRTEFAHESLMQAFHELEDAADHRLYTRDIFHHQTRAAKYLRQQKKDPHLGEPPPLKGPNDGKKIQVFDREEYGEAPMWDYHPSLYDREENAKTVFISAPMDERPSWELFENADELKERVTYKFYRLIYKVPKDVDLADVDNVQKFIDDEHAEMTYDPKYHGVYDGRLIDPGKLEDLDDMIQTEPWDDERLSRVEAKLYKGLEKRVEDHQDARKEYNTLMRQCNFRPSGKTKRLIDDLDDELKQNYEWFASFDRRVYLVYVQMALKLADLASYKELRSRYKFHIPLQNLHRDALSHQEKVDFFVEMLFNQPPDRVSHDLFTEAMHVFRKARKGLKEILRDARDMDIPMLKNFTGQEALDEFLLDETLIKELPESFVDNRWIRKLYGQLGQVLKKSARLYFKSLGNILALQEQVAKAFNEQQPPVVIMVDDGVEGAREEGGEEQQEKDENVERARKHDG